MEVNNMTQDELRELLCKRLEKEKQRYISKVTGIHTSTLSYFKTGGKLYRNTLLIVLYDKNKDMFLKCFKKNSQI